MLGKRSANRPRAAACTAAAAGGCPPKAVFPSLLARQIALLQALLALQQALLCLQQSLLRALRPQAFRLCDCSSLHALLQPIDALLALHALPRKRIALPFLRGLLELLQTPLTLELSLFRLQQPLLRALCPRTFRLLRLQLLHALLHPIDALLALRGLGRKLVALPLLNGLLRLLDALLAAAPTRSCRGARSRRVVRSGATVRRFSARLGRGGAAICGVGRGAMAGLLLRRGRIGTPGGGPGRDRGDAAQGAPLRAAVQGAP